MDKKQVTYYRKIQRFLFLKETIKKQHSEVTNKVLSDYEQGLESGTIKGESGTIKIVRPKKVSHKQVPSVMIDTPSSWKAGVDFPVAFSGNSGSPLNQEAINILQAEYNQLSDEILKKYDMNLDFNILHNDLKYEDLPPKHIATNDDYRTIWWNGMNFTLNLEQSKFIKVAHRRFLETNNTAFDSCEIFKEIKFGGDYLINQLFQKHKIKGTLILSNGKKYFYNLDLDF